MPEDFTIDELAQQAGSRTSTIRLYQSKGLLPPPEIRGRVGYYSASHLGRLRVIERLQQQGYSLAAIRSLLENWAQGASLSTILDPDQELATFGEPTELTQADFAAMFPDGQVDPDVVARAMKLGLVAYDADTGAVRVPSRSFVEIGRELAAYQVPPARAIDEFEHLAGDARRIAERFMVLFAEFVVADVPPGPQQVETLRAASERFRVLAARALQELVTHAIDELTTAAIDAAHTRR